MDVMKEFRLQNKTMMCVILRAFGYEPPVRGSEFKKMFRSNSYWLLWPEDDTMLRAWISACGGGVHLIVTDCATCCECSYTVPFSLLESVGALVEK